MTTDLIIWVSVMQDQAYTQLISNLSAARQ